jgi:hypothetical protein
MQWRYGRLRPISGFGIASPDCVRFGSGLNVCCDRQSHLTLDRLDSHRALVRRKYQLLFSRQEESAMPGPKGLHADIIPRLLKSNTQSDVQLSAYYPADQYRIRDFYK